MNTVLYDSFSLLIYSTNINNLKRLLKKHRAQCGELCVVCLFICTPCSSVSLSITPWRQRRGRRQCAVSTVTDWSLWAVGRHHLLFTVQMFVRKTDWDGKDMRVCVCVCVCVNVSAGTSSLVWLCMCFMSVLLLVCAPSFLCVSVSLFLYMCVYVGVRVCVCVCEGVCGSSCIGDAKKSADEQGKSCWLRCRAELHGWRTKRSVIQIHTYADTNTHTHTIFGTHRNRQFRDTASLTYNKVHMRHHHREGYNAVWHTHTHTYIQSIYCMFSTNMIL